MKTTTPHGDTYKLPHPGFFYRWKVHYHSVEDLGSGTAEYSTTVSLCDRFSPQEHHMYRRTDDFYASPKILAEEILKSR